VEIFPFSKDEWRRVTEAAYSLTNATLADDDALRASLFIVLMEVLDDLRQRHGEHPILIETAADFCDEPVDQRNMYLSAIELAEANGLPTLTIRVSLASLLLQDFNDPAQAMRELSACESEMEAHGDDFEKQEWAELMRECRDRGFGR
jgi:hypothetical protein